MSPHDRLLAEYACLRLQTRYCLTADSGDVEAFVQLFAPGGSIAVPEHPPFVGHDAIRASLRALHATGLTFRHLGMNGLVDILSPTRAQGMCYLVAFNAMGAADVSGCRTMSLPSTVGEYHDAFARNDGEWLFQSRRLIRVFRRLDDPVLEAGRGANVVTAKQE